MKFSIPPHGSPKVDGASWIRAEGPELPHPVLIRLGIGGDERLIATGLIIEADGELATRATRIPLAAIVTEFAAAASKPATYKRLYAEMAGHPEFAEDKSKLWRDWKPEAEEGFLPGLGADFLDVDTRQRVIPRVRPGRRGYPDEHYRDVAKAYRRAKRRHPRAPVRALMDDEHAAEATVHRWLREARRRGFLD